MDQVKTALEAHMRVLIGLPLSIARNAADMKGFHFGSIRPHYSRTGRVGTVGQYALHIQCPWRIVGGDAIVTGSSDRFQGPREDIDYNDEDARGGSLQSVRLEELLKGFDASTSSFVNATENLVVQAVQADNYGGLDIALTGGLKLQIFPAGSNGEDWRFIDVEGGDIVIEAGRLSVFAAPPQAKS